jgi:hypothetical protein
LNVDEGAGKQGQEETEIPKPGVYALPDLWTQPCGVSEVQDLPDLFQDHGERGKDSGREEGKLVTIVLSASGACSGA